MADRMLRTSGRSDSGVAKAIRTDEKGNLRVSNIVEVVHLEDYEVSAGSTVTIGTELEVSDYSKLIANARAVNIHSFEISIEKMAKWKEYSAFIGNKKLGESGTLRTIAGEPVENTSTIVNVKIKNNSSSNQIYTVIQLLGVL